MAIIMAMIISCSLVFHGCEKEDTLDYSQSEFLELSTYGDLSEISEQDFAKISQAIGRMDIRLKSSLYHIEQTSGAQINISEELFDFIKSGFNHTNETIESYNSGSLDFSVPRLKSSNNESSSDGSTTSSDCMAYAISKLSGKSYSSVKSYLESTYGSDGVPLSCFKNACTHFMPNGTAGTSSLLTTGYLNDAIIIYPTSSTNFHAVNGYYYDSANGTVAYRDYKASSNGTTGTIYFSKIVKVFSK